MRVKVEKVFDLLRQLEEINKCPLEQIEWTWNNKKLEITNQEIEDWRFTGLGNTSFVSIILEEKINAKY